MIRHVETDADLLAVFPVLKELRPEIVEQAFVSDVRRMAQTGYRLAALVDPDVRAVAGYRQHEMFTTGRILYVDDLVTAQAHRSKGYGRALLAWLFDEARRGACRYVELDSGMKRTEAHRFYRREGMEAVAYHFMLEVKDSSAAVPRP